MQTSSKRNAPRREITVGTLEGDRVYILYFDSAFLHIQLYTHYTTVVYRIQILESNPAGYLDFLDLDIVSLSTGSGLSK